MTAQSNAPIIIKRVKKVVGGGHHGGAWKVAYADFVTAMMAFFLLIGEIPRSTDLTTAAAYGGLLIVAISVGGTSLEKIGALFAGLISRAEEAPHMVFSGSGAPFFYRRYARSDVRHFPMVFHPRPDCVTGNTCATWVCRGTRETETKTQPYLALVQCQEQVWPLGFV